MFETLAQGFKAQFGTGSNQKFFRRDAKKASQESDLKHRRRKNRKRTGKTTKTAENPENF
jgi:hypothetical protein